MDRVQTAAAVLHYADGTLGPVAFHPNGCATCARAVQLVDQVDRTYPAEDLTRNDEIVVAAVLGRLARHDRAFGVNWAAERNQLRLALTAIEDEHREAYDEWRAGKRVGDWTKLTDELLDVAAVALRSLRELAPYLRAELTRQHADAVFAGDFVHEGEDAESDDDEPAITL